VDFAKIKATQLHERHFLPDIKKKLIKKNTNTTHAVTHYITHAPALQNIDWMLTDDSHEARKRS